MFFKKPEKNFLFLLLILFFLLFHFNSFNAPFERDEGEYAYSAMILKEGYLPYKNSFLQKPPMIVYTYYLAQLIDKKAVWPPRLLMAITTFLTMIIVGKIAKREWGESAQWIAMFIFIPMIMFPVLTPFAANTEKFMILPLVSLVYLFLKNQFSENKMVWVFGGILSSLTVFYKPISFPIFFIIFFFWIKNYFQKQKNLKKILALSLFFTLCFFITSLSILIPFIVTATLKYFFEAVIIFNSFYIKNFGNPIINLFNYLKKFFYYWYILIPLLIFPLFKRPKNFSFYFSLFFISFLTIFSSPMGHYYLQLIPFLTLMITGSLIEIIKFFKKDRQPLFQIISPLIIIFFMIYPIKNQFYLTPEELNVWVYGRVNPFYEAPIIGKIIKEKTSTNDYIFVAGSEPEIYFYSQRKSPTRFIITYPLNLDTPFRLKYQKEAINDLTKNPPKIIVVSQKQHSGLWDKDSPRIFLDFLNHLIDNQYRLIGGYLITEEKEGWQVKLNNEQIKDCSFLVYQKK